MTLPSDCQVSIDPPRHGMFAGVKVTPLPPPNRPQCGGSHACVCHPVYAMNCDSAVSYDAYRNHADTYNSKSVYFLSDKVANVLAATLAGQ